MVKIDTFEDFNHKFDIDYAEVTINIEDID